MTKGGGGTPAGSAGKSATRSAARAVIYCRVSSHEQLKGLSLETQSKACIEFCRSQGMEVAEIFVERAESARTDGPDRAPEDADLLPEAQGARSSSWWSTCWTASRGTSTTTTP